MDFLSWNIKHKTWNSEHTIVNTKFTTWNGINNMEELISKG